MRPATLPIQGFTGETLILLGADVPQAIAYYDLNNGGQFPIGAIITPEYVQGAAIRYTFGLGMHPAAGLGHILMSGDTLYLTNPSQVRRFEFTNYAFGVQVNLTVTLLYEKEVNV